MQRNGLYRIAAVGAVLVGVFLMMGAYGHIAAVRPMMDAEGTAPGSLRLWLPGLILAFAGMLSVALSKWLWAGMRLAVAAALLINALALAYFLYLLWTGVPNHPVGLFAGIVSCNLVLLMATRLGLVWPVESI